MTLVNHALHFLEMARSLYNFRRVRGLAEDPACIGYCIPEVRTSSLVSGTVRIASAIRSDLRSYLHEVLLAHVQKAKSFSDPF